MYIGSDRHKALFQHVSAECAHNSGGAIRGVVLNSVVGRHADEIERGAGRPRRKRLNTCDSAQCHMPTYLIGLEESLRDLITIDAVNTDNKLTLRTSLRKVAYTYPAMNCREPPDKHG